MQYKSNNNIGRFGLGNIDLYNRPIFKNDDGSISTVRSISFNDGNNEILIPTISDDGKLMTNDEAIKNFYSTGKYLGIFKTPEEATQYANRLHSQQNFIYGGLK